MKVLVVNPPAAEGIEMVREGRCMQRKGAWMSVWPPISLALIAAVLEKVAFQVKLYDCIAQKIGWESLANTIGSEKPALIICNTATPSIQSDLSMAKFAKDIIPGIKTAFFGIHVSALPDECFMIQPEVDFVIRGEPEITAGELACYLRDNGEIGSIDGLSYPSNGVIKHNRDRKPIKNLDKLPYPSWHLVDIDCYPMPLGNEPFLMVATSRGCPHRCMFCAAKKYYGASLRLRTPKSVADEMVWVLENFGVNEFLFWSESFTLSEKFVREVCNEIIATGRRFHWVCNSRTDNVNGELLHLMREAGCWMIGYGIESGNQAILDTMGKGTTLEQAEEAVALAKEAGLETTGHFIVGLPSEDERTVNKTIRFAKRLGLDYAQFYCAVPFPGSQLYDIAKKRGWINTNNWRMFEQNYSVMDTGEISARKVMKLRSKAFRRFYIRPKIFFRFLRRLSSTKSMVSTLMAAFDFMLWTLVSKKDSYEYGAQSREKTSIRENPEVHISVVIPAKNEEATICQVIQGVSPFADEILVIDGNSTDKTREMASKLGTNVVLDDGRGKGSGIRKGIEVATGDVLVFIDADGSHEAADIPKLVSPILRGRADMVIASRLRGGSDEFHGTLDNIIRMLGGALLTLAVRRKWRVEITDCLNGYRAIRRNIALDLSLKSDDFVIELEMTVKCLRMGYRISEVRSHEYARQGGISKLRTTQGWRFLWYLLREMRYSAILRHKDGKLNGNFDYSHRSLL